MPEQIPNEPILPISDPDNVRDIFINDVAAAGFLNGVINMTLVTARWTPKTTKPEMNVPPDLVIASRLRMDMLCAKRMRDQLDVFLKTAQTGGPAN